MAKTHQKTKIVLTARAADDVREWLDAKRQLDDAESMVKPLLAQAKAVIPLGCEADVGVATVSHAVRSATSVVDPVATARGLGLRADTLDELVEALCSIARCPVVRMSKPAASAGLRVSS